MKIIIIGSKGMLGQELKRAFESNQLLCWDREEIDITDMEQVRARISQERADVVINAAAYNDVDGAENNESLAMAVNGLAVRYLAEAIRAYNGILVHYSTDYVFKGDKKEGYAEDDIPDPQSAYARTKFAGERAFTKSGVRGYLIRTSRLFGRAAAGEHAKKSFVDTMLKLSETKNELNVVDEEVSSPTYAPDLAGMTKHIIEHALPFGLYHIANSGSCTWFSFAKEIFARAAKNVTLIPVDSSAFPRPAKRPRYSELRNGKLPALRSWQEALHDYLHEGH